MDVLKFIKSVQHRECIYNKNCPDYRLRDIVFDSWRDIAREMNISVIECKEKWHNLRSNYMRERKKIISPGVKKWHLLDALRFLEPHHCARNGQRKRSKRQSHIVYQSDTIHDIDDFESTPQNVTSTEQFNFDETTQNTGGGIESLLDTYKDSEDVVIESNDKTGNDRTENTEKSEGFDSVSEQGETPCDVEIRSIKPAENMHRRRRRDIQRSKWNTIDYEYLKQVRKLSRYLDHTVEDPDRMFLLSLLPLVKQLSSKDSIDFRVEIQQILQQKLNK